MVSLQDSVMADNSRLVAWLDHVILTSRRIRKMKKEIGIIPVNSNKRRPQWFDFKYKNENFSILSDRDDLLLFAANRNCSEKLFKELIRYFSGQSNNVKYQIYNIKY